MEYSWGERGKATLDDLAQSMLDSAGKICSSLLADWQKLDAVNTFVIPKASYQLGASIMSITWADQVDAGLRHQLKKAFNLPTRTVSSFLYTSKSHGGPGLGSVKDLLHTSRVTRAVKCRSSGDISW